MSAKGNRSGGKSSKKRRPWWKKTDAEIIGDRVRELKDVYSAHKIEVDDEDRDSLAKEAAARSPEISNLLDLVPRRRSGLERSRDMILLPVYGSRWGKKLADILHLKTERGIKLDKYGWSVWELCNGRRNVHTIGKMLKARFGKEVEPLYPRLSRFFSYMESLGLIRMEDDQSRRKDG